MRSLRVLVFLLAAAAGLARAGDPEVPDPPVPHEPESLSPREWNLGAGEERVVLHLEFRDVVDLGIAPFVRRVIQEAESRDAAAVILEMDTPGGRVDAAIQIRDALLDSRVPVVVFIHKQAISAGALIALACDYIVWSEGATMGAATPIQMGGGGEAEPVDEKMTSYMRGVMRATAEARDRDGLVAEAMVDADVELPGYAPKGKLLTATYDQAEALGLLDDRAESVRELLDDAGLGDAELVSFEENWAERVARVLTHPVVSSLLMTFGFLGLLVEFYTAGFGLAGIAGIVCLVLFFFGHTVVHLAGWEELLLFSAGLVLLGLEVFVFPGFGVAGVAGLLAVLSALILSLVGLEVEVAFHAGFLEQALVQVFAAVILAGAGAVLAMRFLPAFRPVRRLVLSRALRVEDGAIARDDAPETWLGRVVVAETDLRPVGTARLDGQRVEVQALGEYIPRGTRVRVVRTRGQSLLVRAEDASGEEPRP